MWTVGIDLEDIDFLPIYKYINMCEFDKKKNLTSSAFLHFSLSAYG